MIKLRFIILLCIIKLCLANLEEFPYLNIEDTCFGSKHVKVPKTMNDKFSDLLAIAQGRTDKNTPKNYNKIIIHDTFSEDNPTMGEVVNFPMRWHISLMDEFQYGLITKNEMYPENENVIKNMLKDMNTFPIKFVEQFEAKQNDFKLILWLDRYYRVIFKPQRSQREEQAHPDHFYFDDFDRHNSEIAAYHLDKVLGFRRAIPQIGRKINLMEEIAPIADDDLFQSFFESPSGNNCMTGYCKVYCDTNHAVCGNPNIIEAVLAASMPYNETDDSIRTDVYKHPWKRSYHIRRKAPWEVDEKYCDTIRNQPPYNSGRRLLDIMDLAVMDFLIGNMNRHSYEMHRKFGDDTFIIHSEFGRGFNRAYHDELSILAPIRQCCLIRASTLQVLIKYHTGPVKLSEALREAMSSDPLSPLLWEPHLVALDRRLPKILEVVRNCLSTK